MTSPLTDKELRKVAESARAMEIRHGWLEPAWDQSKWEAFLKAANPQRVLALLDRVEVAERERDDAFRMVASLQGRS